MTDTTVWPTHARPKAGFRARGGSRWALAIYAAAVTLLLAPVLALPQLRATYVNEVGFRLAARARPAVVMVGDSHTDNATPWGGRLGLNPLRVVTIARGGFMARQMEPLVSDAAHLKPEMISIEAGTNDVADRSFDPAASARDVAHLVDLAGRTGARVVVTLPPPAQKPDRSARNRQLAELIAQDVRGKATVIDLWPALAEHGVIRPEYTLDGIHLSPAGYAVWEAQLRRAIG